MNKTIDLRFIGLMFLAVFPILPYGILSWTMAFFIVVSIASFYFEGERTVLKKSRVGQFLWLSSFYFFLVFSLLYSKHPADGLEIAFRLLPLVLFPMTTVLFSGGYVLGKKKGKTIIGVFIGTSFLILVYVLFLGIESAFDLHSHSIRNQIDNTSFLDFHSTYVSLYFLASIFLLPDFSKNKRWTFPVMGLFLVGLLLIFSRAAIFSLLFISVLLYFVLGKSRFWIKGLAVIIGLAVVAVSVWNTPFLKYRITEIYQYGLNATQNDRKLSSTSMRLAVYKCVGEVFEQSSVLGVGIGDLQHELRACYLKANSPTFYEKDLNTHNFYFYMLGSAGLFGLFAFVGALFWLLVESYKSKSWFFFTIFVVITLTLFTENLLSRSYGIAYYCLFQTVFILGVFKTRSVA